METSTTRSFSGRQLTLIVLLAVVVTALLTLFVAWRFLFPPEFRPVELSATEQQQLDAKLGRLGIEPARPPGEPDQDWLRPEPYDEAGASRELRLSERELNGLIARDPGLAGRVAIDLADELASARILVPLDPAVPLLGGRNLRIAAGVGLSVRSGRPVVTLRGISIMGVPMPNAWLGNLKNVDLVAEFGTDTGVWQVFGDGIESIQVADGALLLTLRE